MTTDTEHQRLKDQVVEAACRLADEAKTRVSFETINPLASAIDALRDYLSRSSTQEAVKTCEPPDEHREHMNHWLDSERAWEPHVAHWVGGAWYSANEVGPITGKEMHRRGWRYVAPCLPPSADTEGGKPSRECVKCGHWFDGGDGDPCPRCEVAEQVYPSDEAIYALLSSEFPALQEFYGARLSTRQVVDAINLALRRFKPTPTLSDNTLNQLFTLAKTEAWEQFRVDARAVLEKRL